MVVAEDAVQVPQVVRRLVTIMVVFVAHGRQDDVCALGADSVLQVVVRWGLHHAMPCRQRWLLVLVGDTACALVAAHVLRDGAQAEAALLAGLMLLHRHRVAVAGARLARLGVELGVVGLLVLLGARLLLVEEHVVSDRVAVGRVGQVVGRGGVGIQLHVLLSQVS